jgi:ABC-type multidrug transport system ATPase subunit
MIEIRDCTKKYGELVAVDNLSLSVEKSGIFGLLGPNGAGKSTTIKMLVGLIRPDSGIIKISGYDMSRAQNRFSPMFLKRDMFLKN